MRKPEPPAHQSAAWLWGLHDDLELAVTVPLARNPRVAGAVVHRRPVSPASRRHGIPVTNPLRTVVDLGAAGGVTVDDAIDRGLAARLFTMEGVEAELARLGTRGRTGVQALRAALHRRLVFTAPDPSVLESRFGRLIRAAVLPRPTAEYAVAGCTYRPDFAWPEARVLVELDGYRYHLSPDDFRQDRRRQNDLVLAGWTVLRFTWDDVRSRPTAVVAAVRAALGVSRSA